MSIYIGAMTSVNVRNYYLHCGAYFNDSLRTYFLNWITRLEVDEAAARQAKITAYQECVDGWSDYHSSNGLGVLSPSQQSLLYDGYMDNCSYYLN